MKRGDVYWADLGPRSVSEQTGVRPVIVVSDDGFNESPGWRSIIVVPVSTAAKQARRGPTAIELPVGAGGLSRASVAICHQVTTVDRGKLSKQIGEMEGVLLREVEDGLRAAMDLEQI